MNRFTLSTLLFVLTLTAPVAGQERDIVGFRSQEIDDSLEIGYAVLLVDINGDQKTDIVVVDKHRVLWYENPTWKRRVIIEGKTKPDNVCVAAGDINHNGKLDLIIGADWNPGNTKTGGQLGWLEQPESLDEPWSLHQIDTEPTVHRVAFADIDGNGKPEILLAPLFGQDSNRNANWLDGRPVRLLRYPIPDDPRNGPWKPEAISNELHVMHNIWPVNGFQGDPAIRVLTASYEGVSTVTKLDQGWKTQRIGEGDQRDPMGSRGASEIKLGTGPGGEPYIATIEPWHGNQVVVYTPPTSKGPWKRHVLDDGLNGGHAVWCANLDGEPGDELVIGSRLKADQPGPEGQWGVRVFKIENLAEGKWRRQLVDPGGVAVEDAAVADLNGNGRPDIVAVGRATKNVRIYWNQGS